MIKIVYNQGMSGAAQKVIEDFGVLDIEYKEYVKEMINKLSIEYERLEMKKHIDEGKKEAESGRLKAYDNVKNLMVALDE